MQGMLAFAAPGAAQAAWPSRITRIRSRCTKLDTREFREQFSYCSFSELLRLRECCENAGHAGIRPPGAAPAGPPLARSEHLRQMLVIGCSRITCGFSHCSFSDCVRLREVF